MSQVRHSPELFKIRKLEAGLTDMDEQLAKNDVRIVELKAKEKNDAALWESLEGKTRHEYPRDDLHQKEAVYMLLTAPKLMRVGTHLQIRIFEYMLAPVADAVMAGEIPDTLPFRGSRTRRNLTAIWP